MPPHQASTVGNIYLGKVTKVLPGMDAVFVDYGADKNGFLHRDELPAYQLTKRRWKITHQSLYYVRVKNCLFR